MNPRPTQGRLFKTIGNIACVLAMLAMLGGHWAVLQSLAWARMLGQYAREGTLASALVKTFDGQHPCQLCLSIKHGQQQEQTQDKNLPLIKLGELPDLLCDYRPTPVPLPILEATDPIPFVPRGHRDFIDSPLTPPPRQAAAAS
jgi:hypothetical protein